MSSRTLAPVWLAVYLLAATASAEPWIVRTAPGLPEAAALAALGDPPILDRGRAAPLLLVDLPAAPRAGKAFRWAEPVGDVAALEVTGSGRGWFDPVTRTSLDDHGIQTQSAYLQIDVAGLQDLTDGTGILVAVIDSGVDFAHPDARLTDTLVAGWDWVDDDADPQDDYGHGTRMAGVVAGVLEGVEIMPLRILGSAGRGTTFDVADAITYAADEGADVINLSLGGLTDSQAVRDAVAYARTKGASVVAAAGNDDTSEPRYPAAIPAVVAVAGVDGDDVRADFADSDDGFVSCYGTHIDISAPSVAIETTSWPDDFVRAEGTSYGTALVSAVLAGARAEGKSRDEAEIDLATTSVDIDPVNPGYEGLLGDGRVVASAAVE